VIPEASELDEKDWTDLEALVLESLGSRPPALQRRLRLFLSLVEWLPLLRHARRFSSLDRERRTLALWRLQASSVSQLRVGLWGLRTLALLGYYGRDSAGEAIGYRPDFRGWDGRA
jgi:hypothetical protein